MLRELVVLLAVTAVALAAVTVLPLEDKPDKFKNVQGCYIETLDKVIPFGTSAPHPRYCKEYRCWSTDVMVVTCDYVDPRGCDEVLQRPLNTYPNCCPKCKIYLK